MCLGLEKGKGGFEVERGGGDELLVFERDECVRRVWGEIVRDCPMFRHWRFHKFPYLANHTQV